jgi:archaellin
VFYSFKEAYLGSANIGIRFIGAISFFNMHIGGSVQFMSAFIKRNLTIRIEQVHIYVSPSEGSSTFLLHIYVSLLHTHTHTHTHIYIYVYICIITTATGRQPTCGYNNNNNNNTNNNNNPDIVIPDNEKGTCMLIAVAIPGDKNVIQKEAGAILKYKDVTIEIQRMWNVKNRVIPVIIGETGTISK